MKGARKTEADISRGGVSSIEVMASRDKTRMKGDRKAEADISRGGVVSKYQAEIMNENEIQTLIRFLLESIH
jgi:hypothetical protein